MWDTLGLWPHFQVKKTKTYQLHLKGFTWHNLKPLVSTDLFLCVLFILLFSGLTTRVWVHWGATLSRFDVKFWHLDIYWPAQETLRVSKVGHVFGMLSHIEIGFVYLGLLSRECMFSQTATVTTVTGKSIGSRYMFPSLEVCLILSINLHRKQYVNDHTYIHIYIDKLVVYSVWINFLFVSLFCLSLSSYEEADVETEQYAGSLWHFGGSPKSFSW